MPTSDNPSVSSSSTGAAAVPSERDLTAALARAVREVSMLDHLARLGGQRQGAVQSTLLGVSAYAFSMIRYLDSPARMIPGADVSPAGFTADQEKKLEALKLALKLGSPPRTLLAPLREQADGAHKSFVDLFRAAHVAATSRYQLQVASELADAARGVERLFEDLRIVLDEDALPLR